MSQISGNVWFCLYDGNITYIPPLLINSFSSLNLLQSAEMAVVPACHDLSCLWVDAELLVLALIWVQGSLCLCLLWNTISMPYWRCKEDSWLQTQRPWTDNGNLSLTFAVFGKTESIIDHFTPNAWPWLLWTPTLTLKQVRRIQNPPLGCVLALAREESLSSGPMVWHYCHGMTTSTHSSLVLQLFKSI